MNKLFKKLTVTFLGLLFLILMALKKLPVPGTIILISLQSLSISIKS
jgi:hypothetical protein